LNQSLTWWGQGQLRNGLLCCSKPYAQTCCQHYLRWCYSS